VEANTLPPEDGELYVTWEYSGPHLVLGVSGDGAGSLETEPEAVSACKAPPFRRRTVLTTAPRLSQQQWSTRRAPPFRLWTVRSCSAVRASGVGVKRGDSCGS
jgi:hypothetical protein